MSQNPPQSDAPQGQSLPSGSRLEEFIIEQVLGSGGFGITYLARDSRLGRQVVIKENLPTQFCWRETRSLTVQPRHSKGEDADNFQYSLESFEREASTLASLDHPGIVRVLRSFEAHGTAYFVMPFVEGTALDEVLRQRTEQRSPFTEDEIRDLLLKVLDALGYLHDRGIYHRDIKPGNILMTTAGPVLIDFGAARQRLSERSLTVIESAGYTPFEQLQSRGKVGPWSDIYALGGTLYKVITGETPAKANDRIMDDPQVLLAQRAELRGHYSPRLLESIDQAMAPRAADRFQDTAQWRDQLGTSNAINPLKHEAAATPPPLPMMHTSSGNSLHEEHERILAEAAAAIARNDPRAVVALFEQLEGKRFVDLDYSQVKKFVLKRKDRQTSLVAGAIILVLLLLGGWAGLAMRNERSEKETTAAKTTRLVQEKANSEAVRIAQERAATTEAARIAKEKAETEAARIAQEREEAEEKQRQMTAQLEHERVTKEEEMKKQAANELNTDSVGDSQVVDLGGGVKMTLCYCPPGSFTMGSPRGETNHFGEENPTDTVITNGFWMGRTEITQAQWVAIMGQNPSGRRRSTFPVESVSAIGADKFVSQLNIKFPLGGKKWVLPSEAQWEYACRAGSSGPWGKRGDGIEGTLGDMGWHKFNSGSDIQDVATKNPNAWGLYDMHGNVSEWCADRWNLDSGLQGGNDPFGTKGTMRIIRGGHCQSEPAYCRSAQRSGNSPAHVDMWIGFRVAVVSNDPRSP